MIGHNLITSRVQFKNSKKQRIFTIPNDVNEQCASWDCVLTQQICSILPKYDKINLDETESSLYIEYQGGQTLAEKIKQLKANNEHFTEKELIKILYCLVIGLYNLHKNDLLGRCFNTRNIILRDDGSIVFTKCGFVHALIDKDEILQLPPEVVYQKQYDHRIDQWLLGETVSDFKTDELDKYQEFLYGHQQKGNTFPVVSKNHIDLFSLTQMLLKFDQEDRLSYEHLLNLDSFRDLDIKLKNEMIAFYEQQFPLHYQRIIERIKIREVKWFEKKKIDFRSKSVQLQKQKIVIKRDRDTPQIKVQLIFEFSEQIKKQNTEQFLLLNLGLYCLNLYEQLRIELETLFPEVHFFSFCISQIIVIKIHDLVANITKNFSPDIEIQRCIKALKKKQIIEKDCNIKPYQKKYNIPNLKQSISECFHQMELQKEFRGFGNQIKFNFIFSKLFESILSIKLIKEKSLKWIAYFNGVSKIDDVNQIQSFIEIAPTFYKNRLLQDFIKISQNN